MHAPAPAATPSTADGDTASRIFHVAHRCDQNPATITYCGLTITGTSRLPARETLKRTPCVVCNDLRATTCDLCGGFRP